LFAVVDDSSPWLNVSCGHMCHGSFVGTVWNNTHLLVATVIQNMLTYFMEWNVSPLAPFWSAAKRSQSLANVSADMLMC